ncbi:lipase family alpha/beta hydrolase [Rhodococcus zopfii]
MATREFRAFRGDRFWWTAVGGLGPIDRSAHQLSAFVDEVLAESGAEKVDVLGHSLGTLVAAYWIRFLEGAAKVDRNVSLAPLWHGTDLIKGDGLVRDAQYAVCPACSEMHPDSDFIDRLHTAGPFVDSVAYTNILTERDTTVRPYTSGYAEAPTVTNIVLQDLCPSATTGHLGMLADRLTASLVLSTLDPERAAPTGCATTEQHAVVTADPSSQDDQRRARPR